MSSQEEFGDALVRFDGRWSAEERRRIQEAASEAEAGIDPPPEGFGARWVTTRHAFPSFNLYMATRLGLTRSFVGRTADDLADQIRAARSALRPRSPVTGAEEEAPSDYAAGPGVFWLVYQSRAARPMHTADLRTLLQQSRAKNERLEITGVLLYRNERFMQVLEGDEADVRGLYRTIRDDPRHEDVKTIHVGTVGQRAFPDWRMGAETLDAFEPEDRTTAFLQDGTLPGAAGTIVEVARSLERFRSA